MSDHQQVYKENNAGARVVGFGLVRLVCRAASGSGLKTHGPGRVVIFRPVENSNVHVASGARIPHCNCSKSRPEFALATKKGGAPRLDKFC